MNKNNYIEVIQAAFGKLFVWKDYHSPEWFWLFLILPLFIVIYLLKNRKDNIQLHYSSSAGLQKENLTAYLRHIPFVVFNLGLIAFIIALARPQDAKSWEETKTEGIDIVVTLDVSESMRTKDFKPNRLEASKKIASEFINSRKNDRFGLVVFGDESFTQCPITIDHKRIIELFKDINIGMVGGSTAIGAGIATSVKRLKDSQAKSKVIILLTDGVNTNYEISPKTAAELAETFDIKLYTIGIGKEKFFEIQTDYYGRKRKIEKTTIIDIKEMTEIAELTGGKFFRATNEEALVQIYEEIDNLEKTELQSLKYYKKTDLYLPYALLGLLLVIVSKALDLTIFKTIE